MEGEFKSGLTSTSFLALLYAILIFQPAMIWLSLSAGASIGNIGWVSLIVFAELCAIFGKRLTKQEASVIFLLAGAGWSMAGAPFFIDRIYRAYYAQSEIAILFGIKDKIPPWWASTSEEAWISRSFLHPSWLTPLLIGVIMLILGEAVNISMGLIMREIFIKSMKLPFPMQEIAATGILTVTERAEKGMKVLIIGAIIAMLYNLALYGQPIIADILGYPAGAPPIPWADFSTIIQGLLPGASIGIATDILVIVSGFILPFSVVLSIFIGSAIIYFIGNPLLVRLNLTNFAKEYFYGMEISQIMYRSYIYAWAGPMIGVSLAAGLVPLYIRRGAIINGFRALSRAGGKLSNLGILLGIWMVSSVLSVAIAYTLVPLGITYLMIMLAMSLAWSFVWTIISTYSVGITGIDLSPPGTILPIIKYSYLSLSGITTYDAWFIDPIIGTGGSGWCSSFYIVERCSTDVKSYIKTFLILLPIIFITGFTYVQIFWYMSPIPSVMFRQTAIYWPIRAVNDSLWYSGRMFQAFDPLWVAGAALLTLGAGVLIQVLKLPVSIIAIAAGIGTAIPTAISMLIGAIIGRIIEWRLGSKTWNENKMILAAGISIGSAVLLTFLSVANMMARSLWVMPY
ncbi:hypothetical protein KEJ14_04285 [Candidatus Bathyarchaeota archaeon]|nr:hypothetical protein [Candidatus Bathyarchaeota archaeon]